MQFTQIIGKISSPSELTYRLVKIAVFISLLGYTIWILEKKNILEQPFLSEILVFKGINAAIFIAVLFLLPVNWGLEAVKWKLLVSNNGKFSFTESLKGVLTGVALGFATPHGLGDYFGRILQLNIHDREKLVGSVLLTRLSQFSVTLIFGLFSFLYFFHLRFNEDPLISYLIVSISLFALVLFFGLLTFHHQFLMILKLFPFIWKYCRALEDYSRADIFRIFLFSILRYLVFSLQFVLLLFIFNVSNDPWILFLGVNFVFLAKSIIPTLFELGVREYAAVYFFSAFALSDYDIVQASLCLWIINLLFPAIIGMFLVFKLKLKLK